MTPKVVQTAAALMGALSFQETAATPSLKSASGADTLSHVAFHPEGRTTAAASGTPVLHGYTVIGSRSEFEKVKAVQQEFDALQQRTTEQFGKLSFQQRVDVIKPLAAAGDPQVFALAATKEFRTLATIDQLVMQTLTVQNGHFSGATAKSLIDHHENALETFSSPASAAVLKAIVATRSPGALLVSQRLAENPSLGARALSDSAHQVVSSLAQEYPATVLEQIFRRGTMTQNELHLFGGAVASQEQRGLADLAAKNLARGLALVEAHSRGSCYAALSSVRIALGMRADHAFALVPESFRMAALLEADLTVRRDSISELLNSELGAGSRTQVYVLNKAISSNPAGLLVSSPQEYAREVLLEAATRAGLAEVISYIDQHQIEGELRTQLVEAGSAGDRHKLFCQYVAGQQSSKQDRTIILQTTPATRSVPFIVDSLCNASMKPEIVAERSAGRGSFSASEVKRLAPELIDQAFQISRILYSFDKPTNEAEVAAVATYLNSARDRVAAIAPFHDRAVVIAAHVEKKPQGPPTALLETVDTDKVKDPFRFGTAVLESHVRKDAASVQKIRPINSADVKECKERILSSISDTPPAKGGFTFLFDGHGGRNGLYIENGSIADLEAQVMSPYDAFITPQELGSAFAARQKKFGIERTEADVVLLSACFSHDFAQGFAEELWRQHAKLPLTVVAAEEGQYSFSDFSSAYGSVFWKELLSPSAPNSELPHEVVKKKSEGPTQLKNLIEVNPLDLRSGNPSFFIDPSIHSPFPATPASDSISAPGIIQISLRGPVAPVPLV